MSVTVCDKSIWSFQLGFSTFMSVLQSFNIICNIINVLYAGSGPGRVLPFSVCFRNDHVPPSLSYSHFNGLQREKGEDRRVDDETCEREAVTTCWTTCREERVATT